MKNKDLKENKVASLVGDIRQGQKTCASTRWSLWLSLVSLMVSFIALTMATANATSAGVMTQQSEESSPLDLLQLPLYQGFILNDDYSLVFDKPEGRIIQAQIDGYGDDVIVRQFYHDTLMALGWQLDNQRSEGHHAHYARDAEHLSLEFLRDGDVLMIRFYLHPMEKG